MDKERFFRFCYDVITKHTGFPDVAKTYNDLQEGAKYQNDYYNNPVSFMQERDRIISFIFNARKDNVIDGFIDDRNYLLFLPAPSGRRLGELTNEELFSNLYKELCRLTVKGAHQAIKHYHPDVSDNDLTTELLDRGDETLRKYGLISCTQDKPGDR
ncbi:MAG: hypothetical protein IKO47_13595 [Ruminococcus sp.]|nr:hypothetical protein [Ruminococcus sp.]